MAISREEVDHVAFLARLGLSDDEKATLQEQLSAILEHMRTINELDTSQIAPTAQVIPLRNVMRPDEPRPFRIPGAIRRIPIVPVAGFMAAALMIPQLASRS